MTHSRSDSFTEELDSRFTEGVVNAEMLSKEQREAWLSMLPEISVFNQTDDFIFEVCLPIDFAADEFTYKVTIEGGKEVTLSLKATDFDLIAITEISDVEYQCYYIHFNKELPIGEHSLELLDDGDDEPLAVMSLIIVE